jgi:hypothetical protein
VLSIQRHVANASLRRLVGPTATCAQQVVVAVLHLHGGSQCAEHRRNKPTEWRGRRVDLWRLAGAGATPAPREGQCRQLQVRWQSHRDGGLWRRGVLVVCIVIACLQQQLHAAARARVTEELLDAGGGTIVCGSMSARDRSVLLSPASDGIARLIPIITARGPLMVKAATTLSVPLVPK